MTQEASMLHHWCHCTVDLSPSEVEAGGGFTLRISARCREGCDLGGLNVAVRDPSGARVALVPLRAAIGEDEEGEEDEGFATDRFALAASQVAGTPLFALALESDGEVPAHRLEPSEFTLEVKPHRVWITSWGIEGAVPAGESLRFKAGVKCSRQCSLAGHEVEVLDQRGERVATAVLGGDLWPGTAALHTAAFTVRAPSEPGLCSWRIRVPAAQGGAPHAEGTAGLSFNVVPAPEFDVVIQVVDREQQTPIMSATVVMHPYRAVSDETGVARFRAARGDYRIMVSGSKYLPARTDVSVPGEVFSTAELQKEPPAFNPDEAY
jgi:hypothetical protein